MKPSPLVDDRAGLMALLGDFLMSPQSMRNAGRASALAELYGNKEKMVTRYPKTTRALYTGGGSLLGALVGGLGSSDNPNSALAGAAIGGAGGGLLGHLLGTMDQRSVVRRQKADAETSMENKDEPEGDIEPGSTIAGLFAGPHQQGRADALEAVRHGEITGSNGNMAGAKILHALQQIPATNLPALPAAMVNNLLHNSEAKSRISNANDSQLKALFS